MENIELLLAKLPKDSDILDIIRQLHLANDEMLGRISNVVLVSLAITAYQQSNLKAVSVLKKELLKRLQNYGLINELDDLRQRNFNLTAAVEDIYDMLNDILQKVD